MLLIIKKYSEKDFSNALKFVIMNSEAMENHAFRERRTKSVKRL